MKKHLTIVPLVLSAFLLVGCGHQHTWENANCTTPKTCTACNQTSGSALGHNWVEATCDTPKTCLTCNLTDGEALGHLAGDWIVDEEATLDNRGTRHKECLRCGKEMESERISKKVEFDGDSFNFTPEEIAAYINDHTSSTYRILSSTSFELGSLEVFGIYEDSTAIAFLGYTVNEEGNVNILAVGGFSMEYKEFATAYAIHIGELLDEDLDSDTIVTSIALQHKYTHNGIQYLLGDVEDKYPFVFIASEARIDKYLK